MTSKRVSNAKSERHYKSTGPLAKKKQVSFWQVRLLGCINFLDPAWIARLAAE